MKFVVTGAAGFIGSHLVEALQARGDHVIAIDAFTDSRDVTTKRANARAFEIYEIDLVNAPLANLLRGSDGVFHLAGQPGVRMSSGNQFFRYVRDNVIATQRVFEAAAGGPKVVFASSSSVYGHPDECPTSEKAQARPLSPYGVTKLACEQLAHVYAEKDLLNTVALRYFTVYGPRQRPDMFFARLLEALALGETIEIYGDGTQTRNFVYVSDVVEATIRAMTTDTTNRVFNIGGRVEITVNAAITLAELVTGCKASCRYVTRLAGEMNRAVPNARRVTNELKWTPEVSLEVGLRTQWEWTLARLQTRREN